VNRLEKRLFSSSNNCNKGRNRNMGRKTRNLVLSPLTTLPLTKITVLALLKKKRKK